jgi:hypothetical protein
VLFVVWFFGINAREVDPRLSMFDSRYAGVYFVAGSLACIPVALIAIPYLRDWSIMSYAGRRSLWYGLGLTGGGVLWYLVATSVSTNPIVGALVAAVTVFCVFTGLLLVLFWFVRMIRR